MSDQNHVTAELEFKSFGKISRFRQLRALITEKIDGTNAQIFVPEDETQPLLVGSRTRWITPESDNAGFARFVQENVDALRKLGPGRHFGEWFGAGLGRKYGLQEKRLALFTIDRFLDGLPAEVLALGRVSLVPVLYRGPVDTAAILATVEKLYAEGSVAVPGWAKPEGAIIEVAGARWKITDNGDAPKWQLENGREVA
jgi:hypothetical protein